MSLDDRTWGLIPFQRNQIPLIDALLISSNHPLQPPSHEEACRVDTMKHSSPQSFEVAYVDPYAWKSYLIPVENKKCLLPKADAKIDEDSESLIDEGYSSRSPSVKQDVADFCDETVQPEIIQESKCAKKPRHNVVKRKKVGRPPGENPSAGTLKTRKNRKKFKELDQKALDHGQPFLQHALKRGWRPPADFQFAFQKFTCRGTWKQTAAIRFGGFLPQAKKRGPIRRVPVSLQELRAQEQKKDGMVHKLVQECLTYLQAKLDIPEYNKLIANLPKQMYKTA